MSTPREQPWSDETPEQGRVVVVTDNPIGRAVVRIAEIAGRRTTLLPDDEAGHPLQWLTDNPLAPADALVLCDHDTPDAGAILRLALDGASAYVAMMGSRRRAETVFAELEGSLPADVLARLRVPAGLDIGGKAPGEIALSVVSEIVAVSHGRPGGPMRTAG
jgi:xanthine dehydrogenase accessory factor